MYGNLVIDFSFLFFFPPKRKEIIVDGRWKGSEESLSLSLSSLSLSVSLTLFLPVKQRKAKFTLDKELRAGRANRDFEPLCLESLTKIQIMRSQRWTRDKGIVRRPWLDISAGKRKTKKRTKCTFFFFFSSPLPDLSRVGHGVNCSRRR